MRVMPEFKSLVIVSGGQTGGDRATLDLALAHGFARGWWCLRGRTAEDGTVRNGLR